MVLVLACMSITVNATSIHNQHLAFTVQISEGFKEYDYLKPHGDVRTKRIVKEKTL